MDIFTKKDFLNLADIHDQHCISIYISTHRSGGEIAEIQDRTSFKNQLKEIKTKLKDYNLTETQITEYVKPLQDLHDREDFWRKLSDTLAVFLHEGEMTYYTLPVNVQDDFNYIADHFYLKPLASMVTQNARFFIMVLSLGKMRFFDASEHNITEVNIEGLIPRGMEESITLYLDEQQKQLQYRSQQGEPSQSSMYHGHGAGSDSEKKKLIEKYFKEIDDGLVKMLHDEKAPLVIAGVEYLYPIYKSANSYKYLSDKHLTGNFDETSPSELHARVWDLIKEDYQTDLHKKRDKYHELLSVNKAAYKLEEVIPGSIVGRTETLFIDKNKNVWGQYNPDENSIKVDDSKELQNACLLNRSAIGTIQNGGEVLELDAADMPDEASAAAIFRYEMQ